MAVTTNAATAALLKRLCDVITADLNNVETRVLNLREDALDWLSDEYSPDAVDYDHVFSFLDFTYQKIERVIEDTLKRSKEEYGGC